MGKRQEGGKEGRRERGEIVGEKKEKLQLTSCRYPETGSKKKAETSGEGIKYIQKA